jgi:hypothetical protein
MTVHRLDYDERSDPPAGVVPGVVITDDDSGPAELAQGEEEADEAQAEGARAEGSPAEDTPAEGAPAEAEAAEVTPAAPVATLVPVASARAQDRDTEVDRTVFASADRTVFASTEWSAIKAAFVDDPGASVGLAAAKVRKAIEDLATMLSRQQDSLTSALRDESSATATEQLRLALQGYLAFYAELERLSDVTPLAEGERRTKTALAATP